MTPQLPDTGLPAIGDPRRAVGVLVNDLAAAVGPIVLLLDNLHAISGWPGADVLDYVLSNLPGELHLLATARLDPHRWRSPGWGRDGRLVEIRDEDLRLSVAQADTPSQPAPWPAALGLRTGTAPQVPAELLAVGAVCFPIGRIPQIPAVAIANDVLVLVAKVPPGAWLLHRSQVSADRRIGTATALA